MTWRKGTGVALACGAMVLLGHEDDSDDEDDELDKDKGKEDGEAAKDGSADEEAPTSSVLEKGKGLLQ